MAILGVDPDCAYFDPICAQYRFQYDPFEAAFHSKLRCAHFCFLSIGWLLAHLVYILDLFYQNRTLATVLFALIALGISSIIRCAIPILTDILVLLVLLGFLLLIASPILVPIINLIAKLGGGGGGSPSPSSSSGSTEKMITISTYDNGWEISSETHPATLLDVLCMPGNTLANIIWFLS